MSAIGYSGRELKIRVNGQVIAAVRTKGVTHTREPVDVTNDDSDSYRTVLDQPALRGIDVSVDGVVTIGNHQAFLQDWAGNTLKDVTVEYPDGSILEAESGFFLGNLEFSGEFSGAVMFSATLQSSGPVSIVAGT